MNTDQFVSPAVFAQRILDSEGPSRTPIVVRSLVPVGGTRPGRRYVKSQNRKARRYGFTNAVHMLAVLARRLGLRAPA